MNFSSGLLFGLTDRRFDVSTFAQNGFLSSVMAAMGRFRSVVTVFDFASLARCYAEPNRWFPPQADI